MIYGSVCSGHCAVTQALGGRGWTPAFFAEVEAFPSAILGARFGATAPREPLNPAHVPPKDVPMWVANNRELQRIAQRGGFGDAIPNLGDLAKIDPAEWGHLEWLWGGTPCQAFSIAGKRGGLKDHRGNLTLAFLGLAHELAATGSLRGFTWENVPGILSDKDNAFGCFLAEAVGHDAPITSPHGKGRWPDAGVVVGPRCRLAWRILDTQHFGLPQRRRRLFVVASFGDGPDPVAILFERQGVLGTVAESPGEGEGVTYNVAPSLTASGRGVSRIGETRGQDPVVAVPTLTGGGRMAGGYSHDDIPMVPVLYSAMPMNSGKDFTVREVAVAQPVMAAGPALGNQGGDFIVQGVPFPADKAGTLSACGGTAGKHGYGYGDADLIDGNQAIPVALAFGGNNTSGPLDVATARLAHGGPHGHMDFESETFILEPFQNGEHGDYKPGVGTLRATRGDAGGGSETLLVGPVPFDTTQITSPNNYSNPKPGDPVHPLVAQGHAPAIAFTCKDYGQDAGAVAPTLRAMGQGDSHANGGGQVAVAFSLRGRDGENQIEPEAGEVAPALRTGEGGSSKGFVATFNLSPGAGSEGAPSAVEADVANALTAEGEASKNGRGLHVVEAALAATIRWAVRRLTPVECERLQGTADNFTRIPWRGRPAEDCPDGPRYKVVGNSMSVDVIVWIGARIKAACDAR